MANIPCAQLYPQPLSLLPSEFSVATGTPPGAAFKDYLREWQKEWVLTCACRPRRMTSINQVSKGDSLQTLPHAGRAIRCFTQTFGGLFFSIHRPWTTVLTRSIEGCACVKVGADWRPLNGGGVNWKASSGTGNFFDLICLWFALKWASNLEWNSRC